MSTRAAEAGSEPTGEAAGADARGRVEQRTVAPQEAGWRLDRWIRAHLPGLAFGQLQKLLRTGQFRVDGKRATAGLRLAAGQIVRIPPLPEAARSAAREGERPRRRGLGPGDRAFARSLVIYEDARIIALNKPPGLAVQGGTATTRHVDALLEAFARSGEKPRLVHRLDRDTSGVLVVARTAEVARELGFALQQHRLRKLYWAILVGGPPRNEGVIDLPLAKRGPPGREKVEPAADTEEDEAARWAKTEFKVLARAGKVASWVALLPLTGRTHQLRAHCAALGAPILGDGKYGGKAAHPKGAPKGLMLHARELELPGPKGKPLRITAEPPSAFREALAWLGLARPELPGATLDDWPVRGEDRAADR
ncbi:MAG: RluA family pseudouridine synthase [Geminicoccaceae bacterium]|nr:RluA family pseudouridine synthase [Geminicoccaceae bacterium]MCX8100208.1 RluA family pseudouridine synthase [Geminicoccaceae bacterium]MDW8371073.1 RluA family pseudouridine synthase [Geminicoccaceae bacterium]